MRELLVRFLRGLGLGCGGCLATVVSLVILIVVIALIVGAFEKEKPGTAEPPGTAELGRTRENPAPFGQSVMNDMGIEVTVLDVRRTTSLGIFQAGTGKHYIVATIKLRNVESKRETAYYSPIGFRMVGSKGVIYDAYFGPKTDNPLKSGEFFRGSEVIGDVGQEVDADDRNLVLIWDPGAGTSARYLSLEKVKK